jgi:hypothetical protein
LFGIVSARNHAIRITNAIARRSVQVESFIGVHELVEPLGVTLLTLTSPFVIGVLVFELVQDVFKIIDLLFQLLNLFDECHLVLADKHATL